MTLVVQHRSALVAKLTWEHRATGALGDSFPSGVAQIRRHAISKDDRFAIRPITV